MTFPKEVLASLLILGVFIISMFTAFFSWKYAHCFLSRRDQYVNSRYALFMKKLGWSMTVFLMTFGLLAIAITEFLGIIS